MYLGKRYFRDSYNVSNLLWQFDLSWWKDIIPMLDSNSRLNSSSATKILNMLDERLALFETNVAALTVDDQRYFRKKLTDFKNFLSNAVQTNRPIHCSL